VGSSLKSGKYVLSTEEDGDSAASEGSSQRIQSSKSPKVERDSVLMGVHSSLGRV
jgi:hypothetical protein